VKNKTVFNPISIKAQKLRLGELSRPRAFASSPAGKFQRRAKPKLNGYAGDVRIAKSIIDMTAATPPAVKPKIRTSRLI